MDQQYLQGPSRSMLPMKLSSLLLRSNIRLELKHGYRDNRKTIRWSAYGGEPNTFTLEFSSDGGVSWNTISNSIPATSRSYIWTVPSLVTNNALIRITRNAAGYSDISDYPFSIIGQPVLTATNTCPGYVFLNWNTITGADSYDIMKLSGDTMQVIANTTDTSFLLTPLNKDSSYWFAVRAVHGGIGGRRSIGQNIIPNSGSCIAANLNNDLVMDSLISPSSGRQFTSSQLGTQRISVLVRKPRNSADFFTHKFFIPGKRRNCIYGGFRFAPVSRFEYYLYILSC